jgi:hypothetical protein
MNLLNKGLEVAGDKPRVNSLPVKRKMVVEQSAAPPLYFKRCDRTCSLNIEFNERCNLHEQLRRLSLYSSKQVQCLTLNFKWCKDLADNDMLWLGEIIKKNFPNLRRLDFAESNNSRLTTHGYQNLAAMLRGLKSLKELNLRLIVGAKSKQGLYLLAQSIKRINQLTKLCISLYSAKRDAVISDSIISALASSLKRHQQLTELSLALDGCQLESQQGAISLAEGLQHLSQLTKLVLTLREVVMLREILNALALSLPQLTNLASLCLNSVGNVYSSEKVCQTFIYAIASLAKLTTLELFFGRDMPWPTLSDIATTIQQLPQVSCLKLSAFGDRPDLNKTWNDDAIWQTLLHNLTKLDHVTELELSLWCLPSQISEQSITKLAGILPHFKLKSLKLKLVEVKELTDNGLIALASAIKRLPELGKCSIEITNCPKVSAVGLASLSASIGNLSLLTELTFGVYGCELTDDNMEQLGTTLSQLVGLTKLLLRLANANQITDQGLGYITTNLKGLHSLTELSLMLHNDCVNVSPQAEADLRRTAAELKQLKKVGIHIF